MTPGSDTLLVQASAVAIDGRAVMIEGSPGIGKSSLALALIDRGAVLIGDDGLRLRRDEGTVIASPPPHISGKLEIRHVGIADVPVTSAQLCLIISLKTDAPRLIGDAVRRDILDVNIPAITLPAHDPILALRTQWALAMHGLLSN